MKNSPGQITDTSNPVENYTYKPVKYFLLTIGIAWVSSFFAAWCSHTKGMEQYQYMFMLPVLMSSFAVAMFMIYGSGNAVLKKDFKKRVFNFKIVKAKYWLLILFTMPVVMLAATAVSLLFGQSAGQFLFAENLAVANGQTIVSIIILLLAPTFEELGWRGYGMDSLRPGRNLLRASLAIALLWNLWHLPLFFIKGYYHYEILQMNVWYAINFIVGLVPVAIIQNWLFYKNSRSIIAIILFHFMLNFSATLFQTEQFTKCIVTVLMAFIAAVIVLQNKYFFYKRNNQYQERKGTGSIQLKTEFYERRY
jgi:uncharacterized protein